VRVFIVEPSAIAFDRTHAAKSIFGHSRALRSAGINVEWITNIDSTLKDNGIQNHRILTYTIYDDVRNGHAGIKRQIRSIYYWYLVQTTRKKLREVFKQRQVSSADHLFVPTLDWILLRAIQLLSKEDSLQNRFPVLHILVMYEKANWMTGGYPYRRLLRLLEKFNSSAYFYTETERHAKRLSADLGLKALSFPFPSLPDNVLHQRPESSSIRICALGGGRRDKGFNLLPDIVSQCNQGIQKTSTVEFVIQNPRAQDMLDDALAELERMHNVILLDNQLDKEKYERYLSTCDVMIFPYDRDVYYLRGSGIVNEAVASGKPIVCTRDTSLVEQITNSNGLSATSAEEFAYSILAIINDLDMYRENANFAEKKYKENIYNNPIVRRIIHHDTK